MSVEKITDIGGFDYLRKEGIGFTACVTEVLQLLPTIESKGLYIHMLSKPNNWKFYRSQLCDELKIGKDKLAVHLKPLINLGLVREVSRRNEHGQFEGTDLFVNLGITFNVSVQSPQADYPAPVKPASGKSAPTKQKINNKTKDKIRDSFSNETLSKNKKSDGSDRSDMTTPQKENQEKESNIRHFSKSNSKQKIENDIGEVYEFWKKEIKQPTWGLTKIRHAKIKSALIMGIKYKDRNVPLSADQIKDLIVLHLKDQWWISKGLIDLTSILTQERMSAFIEKRIRITPLSCDDKPLNIYDSNFG